MAIGKVQQKLLIFQKGILTNRFLSKIDNLRRSQTENYNQRVTFFEKNYVVVLM